MRKGDFLCFDCQIWLHDKKKAMMSIFDRFLHHAKNPAMVERLTSILEEVGINRSQ
jgi:hypothetical protein